MATKLFITQDQGQPHVTIFRVEGRIDGATYQALIDNAKSSHFRGARALVLDISSVTEISSAGLVALHRIAQLMAGAQEEDLDGWPALRAVANDPGVLQQSVKLLGPQPHVDRALQRAGMRDRFEIYSDLPSAVASFRNSGEDGDREFQARTVQ